MGQDTVTSGEVPEKAANVPPVSEALKADEVQADKAPATSASTEIPKPAKRQNVADKYTSPRSYKLWGSSLVAALLIGAVVLLAFTFQTSTIARNVNCAIVVCGLALGWLIGTVISPYDENEKGRFAEFAKGIGVFVSGYLVGKVGHLIDEVARPQFLIYDMTNGFRALLFISSFLVATIVTFVFRKYG